MQRVVAAIAGIWLALHAVPSAFMMVSAGEEQIRLLPAVLHLDGPESRHRVLLERFVGNEARGIASFPVRLVSDDPSVAVVEDGFVIPVGDGTTTIRASADSGTSSVELSQAAVSVTVSNVQAVFQWGFRNHVQPVLARLNCSSGACHGALAGKGGFRLSLRGYDAERDYFNIVHQQQGRRVELAEPGASLLLMKPTAAVPHKGGQRMESGSLNYRVIGEWIAAGAPGPVPEDARLERLEVLPDRVTLIRLPAQPAPQQPFVVRAHYADGRTEDVTQWTKFTSSNEAVAIVDDDGIATVSGPGEGAVTAWFSSQIVLARITVPYDHVVESSAYTHTGRRNFIDDLVLEQLRRLNLQPAERCSDSVFIRRAFLDTIGTLPTAAEVREFLVDPGADKRDQLIERLLLRDEFVDYWTYLWSDLLLINGTEIRPDAVKAYYQWIRGHVASNTPWDQFVTELLTASGSSLENGATNFYALHQAPEDMAENVSQAFLGLSIGCAKCHNHPLEKWTNDQYYAFANLFSRVRAKGWGGDPRNGDGKRTLVAASSGELIQPRTGKPQLPAPLDADAIPLDAPGDRREYLAAWLTSADNQLFARSITNRIWRNFLGVGLVEDVDDMRASNPASNEMLLAAAAQALVDSNYDLKSLMRLILQSATYQRSSQASVRNEGDQRHYSRCFPRRLMAEVLLDAVSQVTEVPTGFTQVLYPGADVRKTDFYPLGTRAIQLYDSAVDSYFLQTFGRHQRRITCECERSDEPSMVQVLHIANGDTLNHKLQAHDNRLHRWLNEHADNARLLDEVFLTCLARYPEDNEQQQLLALLNESSASERRELLEDIVWGILSSREFLFNH